MKGDPNPNEEEVKIVIERDEDFSFVLEIIEVGKASPVYNEKLLAITANTALESIRTRLKTAEARAEMAENMVKQLQAQLEAISEIGEDLIGLLHRSAGSIQKIADKVNAEIVVK